MKYAVKLYSHVANPFAAPADYPAEQMAQADSVTVAPAGWPLLMTDAELAAYIAPRQAAFNTWKTTREAAENTTIANEVTRRQQLIQRLRDLGAQLRNADQNWATLTNAQRTAAQQGNIQFSLTLAQLIREGLTVDPG